MPAALTRTGVLEYHDAQGGIRREYRPPSEVFDAASLRSLEDAPITDLHPAGMVTPATYQQVARGHIRDGRQDGKFVGAQVIVQDAGLVAAIEHRDRGEISMGYSCDLETISGVSPEGEHYDAIQRNIRYNHAALIPTGTGRAGTECALRLDSSAVACETCTMRIRFDGKFYDLSKPEEARAFEEAFAAAEKVRTDSATDLTALRAQVAALSGERATALTQVATLTGERDAAMRDRDAARTDAADARDPKKVAERVEARGRLEARARETLGAEAKFDGIDDSELMLRAVLAADPGAKARLDSYRQDNKPTPAYEAYLSARFDALQSTTAPATARAALMGNPAGGSNITGRTDAPEPPAWQRSCSMSKGSK